VIVSSAVPHGKSDLPEARTRVLLLACVLLMIVTAAVYYRAATNPFVNYDDQGYMVENLHVQQGLSAATVRWAFMSTEEMNWHPLTWLSHALDCQLYGLNPAGHHATSILLHVLNSGLLFFLLALATGKTARSLAVAALFALHPINVESVAWIAERKNVLSMFFCLLTLAAYGWYARKPGSSRYLLVAVSFSLGLAAKPMIVTLPLAMLLLDFWPLRRVQSLASSPAFEAPQYRFSRLVWEKVPLLFLSAGSSVITMIAQRGAITANQNLPLLPRLLNAAYAYSAYLGKAFWPSGLASFYPYEGVRIGGWNFLSALLVLVVASYWVWHERRRLYPPVGWLWFLGTMIPMIGIVQVGEQALADRYAYLPLLGIYCIVVWGIADVAQSRKLPTRALTAAAVLVLLVLSGVTWRQIGFWNSSLDLWSHALQVTKDNFMAENYVGSAILFQTYKDTGQRYSDEAMVHFENAARIKPNDPIAHLNIGAYLHEHGQIPEAIEQYKLVLMLTREPHLVTKTLIDLGAANQQLGDYAEAQSYYGQGRQLDPKNQTIFLAMGKVAMEQRIQELSDSAFHHPSRDLYFQLGQLQQAAGHIPQARQSFGAAVKLDPRFADAQNALDNLRNANP
jgi:tetratricopeptide (TPR) repeat protein